MQPTLDPLAGGPCRSLAEAAVQLRRPFMPALVRAKIQAADRDGRYAEIAYFIDARTVIDRLNLLLPGQWTARQRLIDRRTETEEQEAVLVYRCRLGVAGIEYSDVGEGPDHKAARSDALKRAAVHVGIGHCVYRMAAVRMFPGTEPHELRSNRAGRFYLDEANKRWLRERYRHWLMQLGVAEYGLPLDHGEAAQATMPELFPERFLPAARRSTRPNGGVAKPPLRAVEPSPAEPAPAPVEPEREDPANGGETGAVTPAEVPAERLEAVEQPPSRPPATPAQRAALIEIARGGGIVPATLEQLARFLHATMLDRLDETGLHSLRAYVDSAIGGGVTDAELAERIRELADSQGPGPAAAERLATWLLEREEAAAKAA
jgi:hypothetical protein